MVGVRARARGGGRAALPAGEVGKGAPPANTGYGSGGGNGRGSGTDCFEAKMSYLGKVAL